MEYYKSVIGTSCFLYGVNPNIDKPITQAEMYGLREIK